MQDNSEKASETEDKQADGDDDNGRRSNYMSATYSGIDGYVGNTR